MATIQQLEIRVKTLQKRIKSAEKQIKADATRAINAFIVLNQAHAMSDVGEKHGMLYTYHCKCAQKVLKAEIATTIKTEENISWRDWMAKEYAKDLIKHKRAVLRQITRILEVEETMERIRKLRYI